jgi:hypothetical protein
MDLLAWARAHGRKVRSASLNPSIRWHTDAESGFMEGSFYCENFEVQFADTAEAKETVDIREWTMKQRVALVAEVLRECELPEIVVQYTTPI